jgi:hypothetical protein
MSEASSGLLHAPTGEKSLAPNRSCKIEKAAQVERPLLHFRNRGLLDDFHDAASMRINQHRSIVDDRIAIFASPVFLRYVVIGHARFRQLSANPDITLVTVRWPMLLNHIAPKSRPFIDTQYSRNSANDPSDRATDDGTNWACGPLAFASTAFSASGYALG